MKEKYIGKEKAVATFVLGIASLVLSGVPILGLPLGIVGTVVGLRGKKEIIEAGSPKELIAAGHICSIVGAAASIIGAIIIAVCLAYLKSINYF